MDESAPRIYTSALFCQEIIKEQTTNALTAVRIGDSYAPQLGPDGKYFAAVFTIRALFIFRVDSSSPVKFKLSIKGTAPGGTSFEVANTISDIESSARARTSSVDMKLPADSPGLFW